MNKIFTLLLLGSVALPGAALAAVITNGTVTLGVNDAGNLNVPGTLSGAGTTSYVGLRDNATNYEATADGCLCEGWGVGIGESLVSGFANQDRGGSVGLTQVSFISDASTATSVTELGSSLRVTHTFTPSADSHLYQVAVKIENIGAVAVSDLRYTRVMDWDVEPTAFSEYVTIGGTAAASAVLFASDDGFQSGDPFAAHSQIAASGDFTDSGVADHGALFDFAFGALAAGATYDFKIFYGAAQGEDVALNALNAVSAEVYSFGQSSDNMDGSTPGRPTFIFGFSGVGGVVVPPSEVPVPASALLLLGGVGMLSGLRLRRKNA